MRKYLTLILIIFFGLNANAQHPEILGSHISYRAIDTLTYEVKLTVIRECTGDLNALNDTLILKADSLEIKQKPTFISKKDITTSGKNCPNKSICAGGTLPYGFEERIYMDTFSLANIKSCDIYFVWTGNKRYSKLNTTSPSENHYNFAYLNYCATKYNNSHAYTTTPKILTSEGQDLRMGIRLVDTLEINDSIHHSLSNILSDDTVKIKYISPYSNRIILTYLGAYRNPDQLRYPAGLIMDTITLEILTRPLKAGEKTSYCFESNEYRKINGTIYKIGTTRWDMSLIVEKSPTNKTPSVREPSNTYVFKLCSGNSTFVDLNSTDADTSDTTQIILDYSGYKNITETYYNSNKLASSTIEWEAKPNEIRIIKSPYIINVKVIDNACDIQGNNSVNIAYKINQSPDTNFFEINKKTSGCKKVNWFINRKKNYNEKSSSWFDAENNKSYSMKDTIEISYNNYGWHFITLNIVSEIGCSEIYYDSIFLDSFPPTHVVFDIPDSICFNSDAIILKAIPDGGIWKGNSVMDSIFYPSKNDIGIQKIEYNFINKNKCIDTATFPIFVNFVTEPEVYINPDTGIIPLHIYFNEETFTDYDSYLWEFSNSQFVYKTRSNNDKILLRDTGSFDVKLTVTKDGCSNFIVKKNRILVHPKNYVDVKNSQKNMEIFIYPNPAKAILSIDVKDFKNDISYKTFDVNGKEILAGNLENAQNNLDIDMLNAGFYFIEIYQENVPVLRTKFIKE